METKKYNVFAELALSCYNMESYKVIRKNKFGKRFLYHLILTVLFFAISCGIPYARFEKEQGGIQGIFEQYVPDFEFTQNGFLKLEKPVNLMEDGIMVIADTSTVFDYDEGVFYQYNEKADTWEALGSTKNYQTVVLFDAYHLIAYSADQGFREASYSELGDDIGGVSRQTLVDLCNMFIPIIGVFLFLGTFIGILWSAFVNSIILLVVSNIMSGEKVPYMELYTISLYALTPVKLIFAILSAFSVSIPFKSWIILIAIAVYSSIILSKIKKDDDTAVTNTLYS